MAVVPFGAETDVTVEVTAGDEYYVRVQRESVALQAIWLVVCCSKIQMCCWNGAWGCSQAGSRSMKNISMSFGRRAGYSNQAGYRA